MATQDQKFTTTAPVILYFPNLIEPKAYAPKGREPAPGTRKKYSSGFLFKADHPDVAQLKAMILAVARGLFPTLDIGAEYKAGRFRLPFKTGERELALYQAKLTEEGKEYAGQRDWLNGTIKFQADTGEDIRVKLGVRKNGQDIDLTPETVGLHRNAFYSGVEALAMFSVHPYKAINSEAIPGVKLYLSVVHSLNRGKPHFEGLSASDVFKNVAGGTSTENPTADLEDEVPF
jgi:hypothetical protein